MKIITSFCFLAAFVAPSAFFLLPAGFVIAGSMLFALGFAAIVAADYARQPRVLRMERAMATLRTRKERFGLAA